jgi:indole-3-glycerol phosphate synthase
MNERLDALVEATRRRLDDRKRDRSLADLERALPVEGLDRPFAEALSRPGTSVIAEYKRRSPSAGEIRAGARVADVVRAYERGGAAAVSVLTEEDHFGGSLDDLRSAREVTDLPILRKDFTIREADVYDARAMGADAVLLIVAALTAAELSQFRLLAQELDMAALVEVHDEDELGRALDAGAKLVGVNQRDLRTFEVDRARAERLAEAMPPGVVKVAESGIRDGADVDRLAAAGYDAILVGESLVTSPDPATAVRVLKSFAC